MGSSFILLLISIALVAVQPSVAAKPGGPLFVDVWHIHVVNGLSNGDLFAHCKSKDNDIGEQHLHRGQQFQWSFRENTWGTTLFWCYFSKPGGGSVSFDAFWEESDTNWLRYRCTKEGNCVWTAKDDGVYLKNVPKNVDELIHKWNT